MASWWTNFIRRDARRYNVDPEAALSIASMEGLSGRAGDNNTSFGPFQLHIGGALPKGKGRAWAESRQGIDYALRQMAKAGASGKRGRAAIEAIARNFERPADPAKEIAGALAHYGGQHTAGGSEAFTGASGGISGGLSAGGLGGNKAAIVNFLLSRANSRLGGSLGSSGTETPGMGELLGAINAQRSSATSSSSVGQVNAPIGGIAPNSNLVSFSPGADRKGVRTNQEIINFASQVAQIYGRPLQVGTGTNHNRLTVDGNVSQHWSGDAVDIPATGAELIRMGQSALIAAGMNPKMARKQRGGLYNVGGRQIIFNTHIGGDHTNHLHLGR